MLEGMKNPSFATFTFPYYQTCMAISRRLFGHRYLVELEANPRKVSRRRCRQKVILYY